MTDQEAVPDVLVVCCEHMTDIHLETFVFGAIEHLRAVCAPPEQWRFVQHPSVLEKLSMPTYDEMAAGFLERISQEIDERDQLVIALGTHSTCDTHGFVRQNLGKAGYVIDLLLREKRRADNVAVIGFLLQEDDLFRGGIYTSRERQQIRQYAARDLEEDRSSLYPFSISELRTMAGYSSRPDGLDWDPASLALTGDLSPETLVSSNLMPQAPETRPSSKPRTIEELDALLGIDPHESSEQFRARTRNFS